MRKNIILILLSILLMSCSSDDSSSENSNPSLVGQWRITARIIDGNENPLGECEPFNVYNYKEDGTYTELIYSADFNTDCLNSSSVEFSGTWEKIGATSYSFTNANGETSEFQIEFDSNNAFSKTFSSLSNPNDPIVQTITEMYMRIE